MDSITAEPQLSLHRSLSSAEISDSFLRSSCEGPEKMHFSVMELFLRTPPDLLLKSKHNSGKEPRDGIRND